MSDDIEGTIKVQDLNLAHYGFESFYFRVHRIIDPIQPLHDSEKVY